MKDNRTFCISRLSSLESKAMTKKTTTTQKSKNPVGAPRKHDREALRVKFLKYIEESDIPTIAGFAYSVGIGRQQVYEYPELADAIKRCIAKKEDILERGALTGQFNASMAIFSLKQIGWKDKADEPEESSPEPQRVEIVIKDARK